MAMEADALATRTEEASLPRDRRARPERRGRDRRKAGSRINKRAPMRSSLRGIGASSTGVILVIMVITVAGAQLAGLGLPALVIGLEAGALGVALLTTALGSLEQRLTEIRLELMMLNGGRRQGDDRREGDRRAQG
jgi:hypothetical protein